MLGPCMLCSGLQDFLITGILAFTPLFLASAIWSWNLTKMIEAREREQKRKKNIKEIFQRLNGLERIEGVNGLCK